MHLDPSRSATTGAGLIWVMAQKHQVAVFDPASGKAEVLGAGRSPTRPRFAFGSVWIASELTNEVVRISYLP
jgi:hypothetical protein